MLGHRRLTALISTTVLVVGFSSSAAHAGEPVPPAAQSGAAPTTQQAAVEAAIGERIVSARLHGEQVRLGLTCRESGRIAISDTRKGGTRSAAVSVRCRGGHAAVAAKLPASAVSHGHARKGLALNVMFRTHARHSAMTLHLNQPRTRARLSATWLDASSYCYLRTVSDGGGGFESVSTTQANTFGLGYGAVLYTRGWVQPWTAARGYGAWSGSTISWYTPLYGGWATGDGVYTFLPDGSVTTTIGHTTADGNWFYLQWNGWNYQYFAPGTFVQSGIEVWRAGSTQHLFNNVRPGGPAAYDGTWCRY
jgi:hypothetical protein